MAVLKLFSQREDTYAQVMVAVRQAQEMQQKAEKRARKFRKQARLLEQAQKDRNDWEDIAEYCRQQWVKAIRERDHKQDQMSQLARERETIQERLVQITRERDTALRVSENRHRAWEMHRVSLLSGRTICRIKLRLVLWRFTVSTTCYTLFLALYPCIQRLDLR